MANRFADRATIKFDDREVLDVQNVTVSLDFSRTAVQTMNKRRRVAGFTEGNATIVANFGTALLEREAQAMLESVDYSLVDVSLVAIFGKEELTLTGCWNQNVSWNAPNVGTEATKAWEFGARDIVNGGGSSVTDAFAAGAGASSALKATLSL